MCRLLDVPRSSFYAWRRPVAAVSAGAQTATVARRRVLGEHVPRVFAAGRGAYGCRRVSAQLNREGDPCTVGLVADLMRELGLRACQPRVYKRTTVVGEVPVSGRPGDRRYLSKATMALMFTAPPQEEVATRLMTA
jgi:putative transposase